MANPLRNEDELFRQIKEQNITIPKEIWDILYHKIGDAVTAINLLCQYHYISEGSIPPKEAGKILDHIDTIRELIHGIFTSSKEKLLFPELKEKVPLHPIVIELTTHHINNDTNIIAVIVGFYTDPGAPQPIPLNDTQKILDHTICIRDFLEKLRRATLMKDNT